MEILIKDGVKYFQTDFQGKESEFEKIVFTQYKHLFGDNTLLFTKTKIQTATGIGTIPDAFIIDFGKDKWYILEVEISNHDVYYHVVPQLTKFSSALNNQQTRKQLVRFFENEIRNDHFKHALLLSIGKTEIFKTVSDIVDTTPELIIIIEQQHEELTSIFNSLPFKTKINVFKTYRREGLENADSIFQIEPLTQQTKSKISTPVVTLNNNQTSEEIERRKGRGDNDGLTDYLIPVIKLIKSGTKHTVAFNQLADKLGVAYQTVNAQCTRVLGIGTEKFVELINTGEINDFLKKKFPYRRDVIEREL
jgi:hypothetical protein